MKYYIIAGEASGDLHGSNLVRGLKATDPQAQIRCWGGDKMAEAGAELVHHYKEGAVMGITDTIAKAGKLLKNINFCKKDILSWQPDVVVLIDYPGFNMKIAEFCHKKGIRNFYYIAPKTWASREGRNRKLKAWVDRLFIVFPFEIPYFQKAGIPFIYRGNPLIDAVDNHEYSGTCCSTQPSIAILAGSREGEISRMMPVCMEVADRLHATERFRNHEFVIAGAPSRSMEDYARYIGERPYVKVAFARTYDVIREAQAAIVNSGTASLETALIGTPQVVCWSTSKLTIWAARKVLRVMDNIKYISLGNLIVDKLAFRELIQEDFTSDEVCAEVTRLVCDASYRAQMLEDYALIREKLGGKGASEAVAKAMVEELHALRK